MGSPDFVYEQELIDDGYRVVCGIDEVGKGAWAGPLAVGIAIAGSQEPPKGIQDSKALSEKRREEIFEEVSEWCSFWSVGMASSEECDELGMSKAQKLASERAFQNLNVTPDWALVDGKWNFLSGVFGAAGGSNPPDSETPQVPADSDPNLNQPITMIVKGDTKSLSIAAASILAKVTRDRLMRKIGDAYGPYRFQNNKGYPCSWHKSALSAWGATPIHRRSWAFMDLAAFA